MPTPPPKIKNQGSQDHVLPQGSHPVLFVLGSEMPDFFIS